MPERYLSDVLQSFPGIAHHAAPLTGVEAEIDHRRQTEVGHKAARRGHRRDVRDQSHRGAQGARHHGT